MYIYVCVCVCVCVCISVQLTLNPPPNLRHFVRQGLLPLKVALGSSAFLFARAGV